jgi:pilus assembly protein Flp/PilA
LLIYKDNSLNCKWHETCNIQGNPASGWENQLTGRKKMNTMLLKLFVKFQDLMSREEGQDLVEYALVVALVAFGATVGMKTLASGLNTAFTTISSTLSSSLA